MQRAHTKTCKPPNLGQSRMYFPQHPQQQCSVQLREQPQLLLLHELLLLLLRLLL
jgi:hypothetical protein